MNHFFRIFFLIHKLTFRRVLNFLSLFLSYILSIIIRKPIHWGNPFSISVEPINTCNLHCPECPTGQRNLTRPVGILSFDLFRKVIDENEKKMIWLMLYFQGEPLLHPNFTDLVKYANKKNIYTAVSTNAHFLDEIMAKKIIESGLDKLIISFDGIDQESYSTYRIGGNVEKVKKAIKQIVQLKKKMNSKNPFIVLQTLLLKSNEHQLKEIKIFAKDCGVDKFEFKTAQFYEYKNGNPLMPINQSFSRYSQQNDGTFKLKNKLHNRCFRMWSSCVMTWNGDVLPCCFDKDANCIFGNLNNEKLNDIWNSSVYMRFREKIFSNRKNIEMCKNCPE